MLLGFWNFIRGYVVVEVTGFAIERFLNLTTRKGIYIWNVTSTGSGGITMCISLKGFKMLRDCTRKTRCRIKIVKKLGLPFFLFRHRKRKPLLLGVLLFMMILYGFASFVWAVEITGNERIQTEALYRASEAAGLKQGALKYPLDTKKITQALMAEFQEISFVSVEIKGTKAKVSITETLPKTEFVDKEMPCDIVAKKDGVIVSMVTSAGTPQVTVKDVVQKGDLLVSGQVVISEFEEVKNIHYVHAYATILAKSWYEANLSEEFDYIEKEYTGESKKGLTLHVGSKSLTVRNPKIPYEHYDQLTVTEQLVIAGDYALPLYYTVTEYRSYNPVHKQYEADELKERLSERLSDILENSFEKNAKIIDKELRFGDNENGINLQAIITLVESIGESQPLQVPQQQETVKERETVWTND